MVQLRSLVMADMQLELLARPPAFAPSLGLLDLPLFLKISLMASVCMSTGLARPSRLNRPHTAMCAASASSVVLRLLSASSVTAAAQSPHTHRPQYRSRTRRTYSAEHSSVMPQHSQRASSTCSDTAGSLAAASSTAAFLVNSRARSDMARWSPSIEILRGFCCCLGRPIGTASAAATAASPLGAIDRSSYPRCKKPTTN
uniref:Uncharacterized protein n=1 Tax=Triticum urartu TaxID=4572 RepID=A0A8R7TS83_TRIUA